MFKVIPHCDGVVSAVCYYYEYKDAMRARNNLSSECSNLQAEGKIHEYYIELIKEE